MLGSWLAQRVVAHSHQLCRQGKCLLMLVAAAVHAACGTQHRFAAPHTHLSVWCCPALFGCRGDIDTFSWQSHNVSCAWLWAMAWRCLAS